MNQKFAEFAKLFGDHTTAVAMLLHLAERAKDFEEGPFRAGLQTAIEEGGAWLDGECKDGNDQAQTLMEQVIGLMNGSYCLRETQRGPIGIVQSKQPTT